MGSTKATALRRWRRWSSCRVNSATSTASGGVCVCAASRSASAWAMRSRLGRLSAKRRASELRMVRAALSLDGEPSVVNPARASLVDFSERSWTFTRLGSFRSSKNKSRNSSRVRVNTKSSSPEPSPAPEPLPPPGGGFAMVSPTVKSWLPGRTKSRVPLSPPRPNEGSLRLFVEIEIF